jgi:hypothetical protein
MADASVDPNANVLSAQKNLCQQYLYLSLQWQAFSTFLSYSSNNSPTLTIMYTID